MTELDPNIENVKNAAKRILSAASEPGLSTAVQVFMSAVKEIAEIAIDKGLVRNDATLIPIDECPKALNAPIELWPLLYSPEFTTTPIEQGRWVRTNDKDGCWQNRANVTLYPTHFIGAPTPPSIV